MLILNIRDKLSQKILRQNFSFFYEIQWIRVIIFYASVRTFFIMKIINMLILQKKKKKNYEHELQTYFTK